MVWVNELHYCCSSICFRALRFFFFQAEDGIRDGHVTGVQTCALPISSPMLAERERISFGEALRRAEEAPGIATRSLNAVRTFVSMLDDLQQQARSGEGPAELLEAILTKSGYYAELQGSDDLQDESRLENLAELISVAAEFEAQVEAADAAASEFEEPEEDSDIAGAPPVPGEAAGPAPGDDRSEEHTSELQSRGHL